MVATGCVRPPAPLACGRRQAGSTGGVEPRSHALARTEARMLAKIERRAFYVEAREPR